MVLDRIDKKILNTLQENGKITNSKLSKIVGISAPATLERVKRLELAGVITHFTAVVNPEKMVLNESKRAFTYLSLYGYNVDAVIINRIFDFGKSKVFDQYFKSQKKYLEDISEVFAELPIMRVQHQGAEVFGLDALKNVSKEIYGEDDATKVLHLGEQFVFERKHSGFELRIKLPFIKDHSYSVNKYGDEIVIQLGNRRKNIFLPRFVNFYSLERYTYDHPWLIVQLKE